MEILNQKIDYIGRYLVMNCFCATAADENGICISEDSGILTN